MSKRMDKSILNTNRGASRICEILWLRQVILSPANGIGGGHVYKDGHVCPFVCVTLSVTLLGFSVDFQTNCWWDLPQNLLNSHYNNFWSCSDELPPIIGLWLVEQFHAFADKVLIGLTSNLVDRTHYGTPQAWLTFGRAPLNSLCFLTSGGCTNKMVLGPVSLTGMGNSIIKLGRSYDRPNFIMEFPIPVRPVLVLVRGPDWSAHLQTNTGQSVD